MALETPSSVALQPAASRFERVLRLARAGLLATIPMGCANSEAPTTSPADIEALQREVSDLKAEKRQLQGQLLDQLTPVDPDTLPERVDIVSLEGDEEVGTVTHYRQMHAKPTGEATAEEVRKVLAYQGRIFQDLLETKPDAVLAEGLVMPAATLKELKGLRGSMGPSGSKYGIMIMGANDSGDEVKKIVDVFSRVQTVEDFENLTGDDYKTVQATLYKDGAAFAYFYSRFADVTLLPAGSQETMSRTLELIEEIARIKKRKAEKGTDVISQLDMQLLEARRKFAEVNIKREREVANITEEHLGINPGDEVALVYGARHHFCDDFAKMENPPLVRSVLFPKLAKSSASDLSVAMQTCKSGLQTNY